MVLLLAAIQTVKIQYTSTACDNDACHQHAADATETGVLMEQPADVNGRKHSMKGKTAQGAIQAAGECILVATAVD